VVELIFLVKRVWKWNRCVARQIRATYCKD
jgi:hypothetical protein